LAEEFDALQGVDVGVEVADFNAGVKEVVGEVFGHFFGEGGDEDAFVFGGAGADLFQQGGVGIVSILAVGVVMPDEVVGKLSDFGFAAGVIEVFEM